MNRSDRTYFTRLSIFLSKWAFQVIALTALLAAISLARGDDYASRHSAHGYSTKAPVLRQYSLDDRIRYQLWDYTWNPNPDEAITHIKISIGQQRVYVYQGDTVAAESPVTTGKKGHETPTGHFSIISKDINHKSNLYGLILDANGNVVTGDAKTGDALPPGDVFDSADMPYYMRLRDDGVGMHGGYIPGTGPASHGCIRLPHAFAELLYSNVSEGVPVDIVP